MRSLADIAAHIDGSNPAAKIAAYYALYDRYFADLADQPITLLEIGVSRGESLKTFGEFFARGRIIGIDVSDPQIDLSAHPNVCLELCDQRDAAHLGEICRRLAPSGLDIIIDDASHVGSASLASYEALFPFLKPGGLYVVEDLGTGYLADWPDGGLYKERKICGNRIVTHDHGMIGFVKHLVDEVMNRCIVSSTTAPQTLPDRLEFMHVYKAMAVLKKARLTYPQTPEEALGVSPKSARQLLREPST